MSSIKDQTIWKWADTNMTEDSDEGYIVCKKGKICYFRSLSQFLTVAWSNFSCRSICISAALNGMLVYHNITPSIKFSDTHLDTWAVGSVLSKNISSALEPSLRDPESRPLGHQASHVVNNFQLIGAHMTGFFCFNYFFSLSIAPGGSILEEGEKSTWKTSVCVFEANDDNLKTYVQVPLPLKYFFY